MHNKIEINPQFEEALELMEKSNRSLFITGRAGTGKSTLLEHFRSVTERNIVVLAPTGVAAVNINGQTIHSFFGFHADITVEKARRIARGNKKEIYKNLDAIIIDEVSMVRADLLDCVDEFLSIKGRDPGLPFGGTQMIFIGDLYQIPPVVPGPEKQIFSEHYESEFFFDARAYQALEVKCLELEKIYRQTDQEFIGILNRVRNKTVIAEDLDRLNSRVINDNTVLPEDTIYVTTTNDLAEQKNKAELEKLPGDPFVFYAEIRGAIDRTSFPAEEELRLKCEAQVMLLNNDPANRWVNGSIGTIVNLEDECLEVRLSDGQVVEVTPVKWRVYHFFWDVEAGEVAADSLGSFRQYPVKLAWAITIHKSQGKTFDSVVIDLGRGAFASGQLYVALSRCRSLEGIFFKREVREADIRVDYRVVDYLTARQYKLSEDNLTLDDKIKVLSEAAEHGEELEIVYLKNTDEKTRRVIRPEKVGGMDYCGVGYLGVSAYCYLRNQDRNFRLDRILQIKSKGIVAQGKNHQAKRLGSNKSTGIAGCIDVGTTGFNASSDEIVELALVLFNYDREGITGIVESYCWLRESNCEFNPDAYEVHGLSKNDLKGQKLDIARISSMIEKADFLVAHNAVFDKSFVSRTFPSVSAKLWFCSMNGINWSDGKGLRKQLSRHNIKPEQRHRALADVEGLLVLLKCNNGAGITFFAEMVGRINDQDIELVQKPCKGLDVTEERKVALADVFKRELFMELIPDSKDLKFALLKVIAENGGEIKTQEAYLKVKELYPKFAALYDEHHTPSEKIYWESRIRNVREKLISDGLIDKNSSPGSWAISGKRKNPLSEKKCVEKIIEEDSKPNEVPETKPKYTKNYIKCPSCRGEIASSLIKCIYCQSLLRDIENVDLSCLKYDTLPWQGGRYTGEIINGKPYGYGTLVLNNGTKLAGSWIDGELEVKGKKRLPDQGKHDKECKENQQPKVKAFVNSDGSKYEGEWKDNEPNGKGIFVFSNGEKYNGGFIRGYFNGIGTLTCPDGVIYEGSWMNNNLFGEGKITLPGGVVLKVSFKKSILNGLNEVIYPTGAKLIVDFKDEKVASNKARGKIDQSKPKKTKEARKEKKVEETVDLEELDFMFSCFIEGEPTTYLYKVLLDFFQKEFKI